jgi:hypothetical protein
MINFTLQLTTSRSCINSFSSPGKGSKSRQFFQDHAIFFICQVQSCLHHLFPPAYNSRKTTRRRRKGKQKEKDKEDYSTNSEEKIGALHYLCSSSLEIQSSMVIRERRIDGTLLVSSSVDILNLCLFSYCLWVLWLKELVWVF